MEVLTKCGIFIGYCKHEKIIEAITWEELHPPKIHYLGYTGVVMDSSESYTPFYTFIILALCTLGLIFACFAFLNITEFTSLPLMVNQFFIDEFQKLNYFRIPVHEQLLKFDKAINQAKYRFYDQLFIIENDEKKLFLVVFSVKRNEIKTYEYLPFIIYKVSDIFNVTLKGIWDDKYGPPRYTWQMASAKKIIAFMKWIDNKLMEINPGYKKLRLEELDNLIQEEEKFRELKLQRDPRYLKSLNESKEIRNETRANLNYLYIEKPVSTRFFAVFLQMNFRFPFFVDENLQKNLSKEQCTICLESFVLREQYGIWPCSSTPPHYFHYNCIISPLRENKNCPLCRQPATLDGLKMSFY